MMPSFVLIVIVAFLLDPNVLLAPIIKINVSLANSKVLHKVLFLLFWSRNLRRVLLHLPFIKILGLAQLN
jgi:hypothetical protein